MARGRLPAQTPLVPPDSFIAIDFLYRFVQELDSDVRVIESGGGGGGTPQYVPELSTVTLAENFQYLFRMPIEVDGTLVIDGYLVEV